MRRKIPALVYYHYPRRGRFVSTPASVAKLMQQIPGAGNQMKAFEALLHVKIAREVPVDMEALRFVLGRRQAKAPRSS